jgi:UTP:GlnB (protein PII) uridylyltransferase
MQDLISLDSFSHQAILDEQFTESVPEFYQLQNVVESQGWHDDQTVFDHSIDSAKALDRIVQFDDIADDARAKFQSYLNRPVEEHSRLSLLKLATLLHDIGKLISLQYNAQGNTSSPSHGLLGSWVATPVLARFDITDTEKAFVLGLIADHLVPPDLIELSINNHTPSSSVADLLRRHRPNTTIELLLLAQADWAGCDVRDEAVSVERDKRGPIARECLLLAVTELAS